MSEPPTGACVAHSHLPRGHPLLAAPCLMPPLTSPVAKVRASGALLASARRPCRAWPFLPRALPRGDRLVGVNPGSTSCCPQAVRILHGHRSSAFCFVPPAPKTHGDRCLPSPLAGGAFGADCCIGSVTGCAHSRVPPTALPLPLHKASSFSVPLAFVPEIAFF